MTKPPPVLISRDYSVDELKQDYARLSHLRRLAEEASDDALVAELEDLLERLVDVYASHLAIAHQFEAAVAGLTTVRRTA